MSYFEEDYKAKMSLAPWKKLIPFFTKHKKRLALIIALMLFNAAADVSYPLFMRFGINHFVAGKTTQGLLPFFILVITIGILQGLTVYWFIRVAIHVEIYVSRDLRHAVFEHLQRLPFSYYNKTPVGYMLARTMSDTQSIGDLIAWSLVDVTWALTYIIGVIVTMFTLDYRLALIVLVSVPVLALLTWWFQSKVLKINREARKLNSQMTGAMNEGITGARTTKTLRIESQNDSDFYSLTDKLKRKSTVGHRMNSWYYPLVFFTGTVTAAAVLAKGGSFVIAGGIIVGTLAAFVDYATSMFGPISQIANVISNFIRSQVNAERVTSLLALEPEIRDLPEVIEKYGDNFNPKKENWEPLEGHVEFRDVTFRYPDGDVNVLEHFDLEVKAGQYVAIVGETGAGKSTLVNLVCRFFEPTEGCIYIDGRDARERSQLWLHSHLGYVLQNPHLFSGSVLENIRYGRLEATDAEVHEAARLVAADTIISRLDKGWDSDVGEGGDKLSTGQKQLVSLARAVLADPRIFVLDEATSSIDTETEALIQRAIAFLLKGRTAFVIAHRLSTIRNADKILVVHDGKVVERGSHEELIKKRSRYFELYTRQYEDESAFAAGNPAK